MKIGRMLLSLALLLCMAGFGFAEPEKQPNLSDSTLAVYHGKQVCDYQKQDGLFGPYVEWGCKFKSEFICTATVVGHGYEAYTGLTAGHCFDWDKEDEYYVSSELSRTPVLRKIKLIKFENDERYDFAIFEFTSARDYPVMPVDGSGADLKIGDVVHNVNYSLGLVKQETEGKIVSLIILSPADMDDTKGRFLVSIGIGPGASGSAVVANGKIVGIVEAIFPQTQMPTVVIPTGKLLLNFLEDDSAGIKPKPEPKVPEKKLVLPEQQEGFWNWLYKWYNKLDK